MLARLFAITILLLATPLAAAAPGPSPSDLPQTSRYVYAELALAQPNLTTLVLSGDIWAYRYDVRGKVYDADEIGEAYLLQNKYLGEPSGDAFVLEVERAVRDALGGILGRSFTDATISGVSATVDRSSLKSPGGNPYDPPVHVSVTATIARTAQAVGLGDLSSAAVDAAFDAGARVQADFTLTADQGYDIRYALGAPSGLRWESGGGVSADGGTFSVTVDNSAGNTPSRAAGGRIYDGSVTPPAGEDIRSAIDVTMGEIQAGAAGIPITVEIDAEVRALDVAQRFPGALPVKVVLPFVNADGVRALRATGAIDAADIKKADDALLAQVRGDVERAFGPGATVTGGLSSADLARAAASPFAADPPLHFLAEATTTYVVAGADADDIDLALRVGGTAEVDLKLFAANGRETKFTIHPPPIGEFTRAEGGTVSANGLTANFEVPNSVERFEATVHMRGRDVPTFSAEEAEISVVVDIADVDAGVGKALGGDLGNLLIDITVTGNMNVIKVPDDLKGSLPEKLQLEFLSSDAIRLLLERGYISEENLSKLEATLDKQVREKLGAALGGDVPVESDLERGSLAAGLVASPISGDKPVVFKASAYVKKPLAGGKVEPQGAIALYTQQLPLTLPKIQGFDTVYTVIAPRGLAFTSVTGSGADIEKGESADGREQFTVRPEGESATITASVAVTPTFVLLKFWPLVLLAVLLLVLIVGTPVTLVVMKRRKAKGAAAKTAEKK